MEESFLISALKFMPKDLVRLDRFDRSNFVRWKDKIKFLLTTLKVHYILDKDLKTLEPPKNDDSQ